ncbi:FAD-dependent oxidoreductase [Haloarcula litorea]|uniref:FAD-dependent oxidoreductase n=1 Tax=Haloarcula litorea TaxID=3032579 RepID=UPI0023E78137|nr:FAD-dependent oxidoreductase [Halomicroarcula sp. GDY20]
MAGTDTVGETLAARPDSPLDHDVCVVGGGAAGLSAATFLARYGLDTLVLARGNSAIGQCACLENYLGFPGGIAPDRFLALGETQVAHEGGTVREEAVERVDRVELGERSTGAIGDPPGRGGFRVESDAGEYRVRYVLAATAYDGEMFAPFEDEVETDGEFGTVDSDGGRTPVEGLYAAGWMTTETVHQAVVGAGHGARAAVSLIRDDVAARFWPAVGDHYVDWVVREGRYGGDDWDEHTREWFEDEVLVDDVDDDLAAAALAHLRSEFRAREIDADERERRDREGQRRLLERLDDDVVREHAATLDGTETP